MKVNAPSGQVPTLRSALRRAERAGATVENVNRTGEVRVSHGDTRIVVNARRKDSTRELTALVERLEAEAPEAPAPAPRPRLVARNVDTTAPAERPKPARTHAERIMAHLHQVPADSEGWRRYSSVEVGAALGLTSTQVAIWANYAIRRGVLEARRLTPGVRGSHITAVRFLDAQPDAQPDAPPRTRQEAQEAPPTPEAPRPIPLGVAGRQGPEDAPQDPPGFLPVPTLSMYARALKQARLTDNRMVQAHLSEADRDAILAEAVRLYWWARARD